MGMCSSFLLLVLSILVLECKASENADSYKFVEPKVKYPYIPRALESFTPKLKIRFTNSENLSQNLVVTLQDPCTVSTPLICLKDPAYTHSQIPSPIKLPLSSSSSSTSGSGLVYEYSGSYTYPISIDSYYHTTGIFTLRHYPSLNLTGTFNQIDMKDLSFFGQETGSKSSFYLYGYLRGPADRVINLRFYHDDTGDLWVNTVKIYTYSNWGKYNLSYEFSKDLLYYIEIIVNNRGSNKYGLELEWNITSAYKLVDSSYMTYPIRIAGIPYILNELRYNTYCDDVGGFKCIVCDGICVDCEDNASTKICISCKSNSTLSSGQCVCDPMYYLSAADLNNCKPCTGLCDECEEISGVYRCKTCKNNATLNTNTGACSCNDGYYLSAAGDCKPCIPLCYRCEESLGSQVCLACKESSRLESNDCICIEGYYLSYSDLNPLKCYECPVSCLTCEEDIDGIYCTSCKEGNILKERQCECTEGSYLYDDIIHKCEPCDELCSACNSLACIRCIDNGELIDGKCYCKEGYYQSITDPHTCSLCMNENCKTCEEMEGKYECTSCTYPYTLSEYKECICESEDFTITDGACSAKDFKLSLKPSLNLLEINFNKLLIRDFTLSDLNYKFSEQDIFPTLHSDLNTIEDYLRYAISYQSSQPINTTISVTLTVSDIIQDRQLQNLDISYYSVQVPILFTGKFDNSTIVDNEESEECKDTLFLEEVTIMIIIVSCSVLCILGLLNKNLHALWSILNIIQILKLTILFNIKLPCKIKSISKAMSYSFIPNVIDLIMRYEYNYKDRRCQEMIYDTTIYIINTGDLFTILIINTALYIVLKFTHYIIKGRDSKMVSLISKSIAVYEWSFYLRFLIQGYLDILVSASFTVKYLPRDIQILDYIVAGISYILLCIFPVLCFRFLYKKYELLHNDNYLSKWGSLYVEYDFKKSKAASYFTVVYLSRRLLYSISINNLDFNPIIQLGFCYLSSLYVIVTQCIYYILSFKPYEGRIDQVTQSMVEISIFIYFILLNVFINNKFTEAYEIIEWICVIIMLGCVSTLAFIHTLRLVYQLIQKLRECLNYSKVDKQAREDKKDTVYSSNGDTTQHIDSSYEYTPTNLYKFYDSLTLKNRRLQPENLNH